MFAPQYLSKEDRDRLVEINQTLLSSVPPDEHAEMCKERAEISARQKNLADCTYSELQEMRQQLFNQHQKLISINSSQTVVIEAWLRQVEYRSGLAMLKERTDPPEVIDDKRKNTDSPNRVPTKSSRNSWAIDIS